MLMKMAWPLVATSEESGIMAQAYEVRDRGVSFSQEKYVDVSGEMISKIRSSPPVVA